MKIKIKIIPVWIYKISMYGLSFLVGFSANRFYDMDDNPYVIIYIELILFRIKISLRS